MMQCLDVTRPARVSRIFASIRCYSCPVCFRSQKIKAIGAIGSVWLSDAVFGGPAVRLRSSCNVHTGLRARRDRAYAIPHARMPFPGIHAGGEPTELLARREHVQLDWRWDHESSVRVSRRYVLGRLLMVARRQRTVRRTA